MKQLPDKYIETQPSRANFQYKYLTPIKNIIDAKDINSKNKAKLVIVKEHSLK